MALSGLIYSMFFWDYGRAYLADMYDPMKVRTTSDVLTRIKSFAQNIIQSFLKSNEIEELEKIGLDTSVFTSYLLRVPLASFGIGLSFSLILFRINLQKSILVGVICLIFGLLLLRIGMSKEASNYRKDIVFTLPELVNNLKISIMTGDPVELALENSLEFIPGSLHNIIVTIVYRSGANQSFTDSLTRFISVVEIPEVLNVFQRIFSYHTSGIPNRREVFSDMAEHLDQIRLDRQITIIERVKVPLTALVLVGFLSLIIQIGVPTFSDQVKQLINI